MTLDHPVVASLAFFAAGVPVPYDRNAVAWRTTPPRNRAWRETVRAAFQRVAEASGSEGYETHEGAVSVALGFAGANALADLDNLTKEVHDALNGVAWPDDRQIAWQQQARESRGDEAGVRVVITYHVATDDELKRARARERAATRRRDKIGEAP
jgi:hypothetical protein